MTQICIQNQLRQLSFAYKMVQKSGLGRFLLIFEDPNGYNFLSSRPFLESLSIGELDPLNDVSHQVTDPLNAEGNAERESLHDEVLGRL